MAEKESTPWYVSSGFLLFAVVFLTPAWIAIKLARPGVQRIKVARVALSVYAVLITIFINNLAGDPFSNLFAPAEIEFGSKYAEAPGQVSIVEKRTHFSNTELVTWLVHLKEPVNAVSVDLSLAKVGQSGGDLVVSRSPLYVANPNYNILYGQLNPLILIPSGTGKYRMYITRETKILARGEFNFDRR